MVRIPGSWKSLDDLEENVTMNELERMLTAARKIEHETRKFQAAMQGVKLDDNNSAKSRFEEIEERARARAQGKTVEELEFSEIGINFESDDE